MIYRFIIKDKRIYSIEEVDVYNPDNGYTLSFREYLSNMRGIINVYESSFVYGVFVNKNVTEIVIEADNIVRAAEKAHGYFVK